MTDQWVLRLMLPHHSGFGLSRTIVTRGRAAGIEAELRLDLTAAWTRA